jgi:hypothetical protein
MRTIVSFKKDADALRARVAELEVALREMVAVIKPLTEIDDNVCYLNGRYCARADEVLERAERVLGEKGTQNVEGERDGR